MTGMLMMVTRRQRLRDTYLHRRATAEYTSRVAPNHAALVASMTAFSHREVPVERGSAVG
jgi:hypothetical protein